MASTNADQAPSFARLARLPSAASRALAATISRIARDPTAPILIEGESGSGKSLVAAALHELSPRKRRPFIKLDLAAVSAELSLSDLFGHEEGAFTGAKRPRGGLLREANTGTLFVDELGEADLRVQQPFLTVIESGEARRLGSDRSLTVDVRIIAATNITAAELLRRDLLLPDLYARFRSFSIRVPPLRERRKDLKLLITEAFRLAALAMSENPPEVDDALISLLMAYDWPDNVRQLYGDIRRIVVEAMGERPIAVAHCPADLGFMAAASSRRRRRTYAEYEDALRRAAGDATAAAKALGVNRSTMFRFKAVRRTNNGHCQLNQD